MLWRTLLTPRGRAKRPFFASSFLMAGFRTGRLIPTAIDATFLWVWKHPLGPFRAYSTRLSTFKARSSTFNLGADSGKYLHRMDGQGLIWTFLAEADSALSHNLI
jgi:hypothetical protein